MTVIGFKLGATLSHFVVGLLQNSLEQVFVNKSHGKPLTIHTRVAILPFKLVIADFEYFSVIGEDW